MFIDREDGIHIAVSPSERYRALVVAIIIIIKVVVIGRGELTMAVSGGL